MTSKQSLEQTLWAAADKLRGNLDAAEYKHVALGLIFPAQLFYNVAIPACLWFVARNRENRKGTTLFIDARNLGHMVNRRNRDLSEEDIAKIADTYHSCKHREHLRSGSAMGDHSSEVKEALSEYQDIPGFCKVATTAEIAEHDYVLTPGRYVGSEAIEDDDEAFQEKMIRLTTELNDQFAQSHQLEARIAENLQSVGYDVE